MQKIHPCLWFEENAQEAVNFYVSAFPNSKITETTYYTEAGRLPQGSVLTLSFTLNGAEFMALNGGPWEKYTGAISLVASCDTQQELDAIWDKLTSDGGQAVQCGWLKDKYGISWQIVPTVMTKLMRDPDKQKVNRVMEAMMKMIKLDIAQLQAVYDGR